MLPVLANLTPGQLQMGLTIANKLGISMPMLGVVTSALNDKTVFNDDGSLNDARVEEYGSQLISLMDTKSKAQTHSKSSSGIGCPCCGYWIKV